MTTRSNIRDYVLGNSTQEQERLKLQARVVGGWTEKFFLAAGLERGMRVLDLGCGMGDVSLLAAEIVGPSGSVTGIDRDSVVVEKARQRLASQGHATSVEFVSTDLFDFVADRPFDAVVGRYVLLYQPDASAALRHVAAQVRPGGILCFHEMAFGKPARSFPEATLFEKMGTIIGKTFYRIGIDPDAGLKLAKIFAGAGFPRPTIKAEVPVGGEAGSYLYGWLSETIRTLLPTIEKLGIASADEIQIDTLAKRMEEEVADFNSVLIGPVQIGAWLRKP